MRCAATLSIVTAALAAMLAAGCSDSAAPAPDADRPLRLLSLAPNVTEILFAMGLGDQIVGRSNYGDYPPEAANIPSVGDTLQLNQEKIIALRPTIAFVITRREDLPRALEAMGIRTVALRSDRMDQLLESIRTIGRETRHEAAAQALLDRLDKELAEVRARVKGLPRPRTLFAFPMLIGSTQMGVAGRGTFVDDLLDVAGAENAYPDRADWPEITPERVMALAPETVLVNATAENAAPDRVEAVRRAWARWTAVPAVAAGRVYVVTEPYLTIPGPRVGLAARRLAEILHPEARAAQAEGGAP